MDDSVLDYARELVQGLLKSCLDKFRGDVSWPKGGQFSPEAAQDCIEELVQSWGVDGSWRHCTDYLGLRDGLHCFRVLWSQPSRRNPVPRATAAIYFFIMVGEEDSPVTVLYVVEGQMLVHRPAQSTFQEVWLKNVIANKLSCTSLLSIASKSTEVMNSRRLIHEGNIL